MSKFQIILLVTFGVFIVIAVATFSLYRGSSSKSADITIWGDIPQAEFNLLLSTPTFAEDRTATVTYFEKSAVTLEEQFTEALARGVGPDIIILTQDKLWKNRPKLLTIPYQAIGEREFSSAFIEEGELFLGATGIYALPFSVNPLVLYYNRDLLSSAGVAQPIRYWDEIYAAATNLSKRDAAGNLISSIMALGEARNIPHAKDIMSLLLLQAGTPITSLNGENLKSELSSSFGLPVLPSESALDFYTQFSNPTKVYYSWNRSLIDAQTHFTAGDSAYYLGLASEYRILKNKNPTLNFGVTLVPQSRVSGKTITFGMLKGVAISRGTRNPAVAMSVVKNLASKDAASVLSKNLFLPPARRDLLLERPTDAVMSVFYDAALQSKGWLDPDTLTTKTIFDTAIESITSGRARTSEAAAKANREIDALIR